MNFLTEIVDLSVKSSSGEEVLILNLYDSLVTDIPDDSDENFYLVEELERKGFIVTGWGRGNFPQVGPRRIDVQLRRQNCKCVVSKIYFNTHADSLYQVVEGISCSKDLL